MEQLKTKSDLLGKLRAYAETPDDDVIRFKEKIKYNLLRSPEILLALNYKELEPLWIDEKGVIDYAYDEDGNLEPICDIYFNKAIRDYLFIPEVQSETNNFLCYTVSWNEMPKYDNVEYYAQIIFTALCNSAVSQVRDSEVGLARHDLIGSIIRERFNWSNIFGTQCHMVSNREKVTDSNYITREIIFQCKLPNAITNTSYGGKTHVMNYQIRRW